MLDLLLLITAIATGAGGGAGGPAPKAEDGPAANIAASAPPAEDLPPGHVAPLAEPPEPPPYVAEQQVATGRFTTAVEVKPILEATRANWVAVREFDGKDLVYVTHLWSWRCGLVAVHYAINDAPPEPWPLPACREETNAPNALPDDDLPYRSYPLGLIETVTVEIVYDDLTTSRASFNRLGAMLP